MKIKKEVFLLLLLCFCTNQKANEASSSVISNKSHVVKVKCYETQEGISKILSESLEKASKNINLNNRNIIYSKLSIENQEDKFIMNYNGQSISVINKVPENFDERVIIFSVKDLDPNASELKSILQDVYLSHNDIMGDDHIIKSGIGITLTGNIDSTCNFKILDTSMIEY